MRTNPLDRIKRPRWLKCFPVSHCEAWQTKRRIGFKRGEMRADRQRIVSGAASPPSALSVFVVAKVDSPTINRSQHFLSSQRSELNFKTAFQTPPGLMRSAIRSGASVMPRMHLERRRFIRLSRGCRAICFQSNSYRPLEQPPSNRLLRQQVGQPPPSHSDKQPASKRATLGDDSSTHLSR